MKFSPKSWLVEIFLLAGIFIAFFYSITLLRSTQDPTYIYYQYTENWYKSYIIDLYITNTTCKESYFPKKLGMWTGFNEVCLCKSKATGFQKAYDKFGPKGDCSYYEEDTLYNCRELPFESLIYVNTFRNLTFCVLRQTDDFNSIFRYYQQLLYDKISAVSETSFMNDVDYMNFLTKKGTMPQLSPSAIIDIKMVNLTRYPLKTLKLEYGIDLSPGSGYERSLGYPDPENSLFIKRLGNSPSILDVNNLICNFHLHNEIWCSFLDISPPKNLYDSKFNNYGGFEYCENYANSNLLLTSNDNFKRMGNFNFDFDQTFSKQDFYKSNKISDYYVTNNITYNTKDIFPNNLVYERYFYGIGCPYLKSVDDHLDILDKGRYLLGISVFYFALCLLAIIFSFVFICCRCCENCSRCPRCFGCNICLLTSFTILNLIFILTYFLIANQIYVHLLNFASLCQVDYLNPALNYENAKTNPNEQRYFEKFLYPTSLSLNLVFLEILVFILIIFYIMLCCWEGKDTQIIAQSDQNQTNRVNIEVGDLSKKPEDANYRKVESNRAHSYISDNTANPN